jgi:cytochrome c oxidase cbb3-type subunit 3
MLIEFRSQNRSNLHGNSMRTRTALLALASCALAAVAVVAQQAQPQTTNPFANDAAAVSSGRDLYAQTCQSCHGPAGQGSDRGPALATTALLHGNADADLFRSIRTGVPGTQMAGFSGLSESDIWRLVAYLRTLQNSGSASSAVANGDAAAGESLFFGAAGCAGCHEVNARGGIVGPDLSGAGSLSPAVLRLKIVDPNNPAARGSSGRGARGSAAPATVVVKTNDGREIKGVRRNQDTFSLQMIDLSGQLHLLDKRTLASVSIDEKSLHPPDYKARLSESDVTNLVAYLVTLRGRDTAKTAKATPVAGGVTYERLLQSRAEPHNWLMFWGDYQGTHYSPLSAITPANVAQLRSAWSTPVPGDTASESTPQAFT